MSFLEDRNVQFGYTGITQYANCGGLLQETGNYYERDSDPNSPTYDEWILKQSLYWDKLILTDGVLDVAPGQPQVIYLDDCSTSEIAFPCNEPVGLTQDGKSVDIVNVCSMPITITGFDNSDPTRFTLFDFESYKGIETYDTGNCEELPHTIHPYSKLNIPVFFHPSRNEIEDGKEGTWDNRTGDSWGARISISPGFPILSCASNNECDAYFQLSGELICNELNREPLMNYENFEGFYSCEDANPLGDLEFENCLLSTPIFGDTTENSYSTFFAFQGLVEQVESKYCKDNESFRAAIKTVKDSIFTVDNLNGLLNKYQASVIDVNGAKITGTYNKLNELYYFDGDQYTGMHVRVTTESQSVVTSDVTVFMGVVQKGGNTSEKNIFLSEKGDFANEGFCYSQQFLELDAARYSPVNDIIISSNSVMENLPAGTIIGTLTAL